jgi:hypothetical protein
MPNYICTTCGTQFAETDQPPVECRICIDERQYVGWSGQRWTTLEDLRQSHRNVVRLEKLGLYGIGMEPSFDGGTVLHLPEDADGKGAILSGDILQVVEDRRWVSFMYSYPNLIPLSASTVRRIVAAVEPYKFDRIYGAWWGKIVATDAKAAVKRSADRYIQALEDRQH